MRTSKGVYALACLAGMGQQPTARNPRAPKKVSPCDAADCLQPAFVHDGTCSAWDMCLQVGAHFVDILEVYLPWYMSEAVVSCMHAQHLAMSKFLLLLQPRRHAVDEGWDGDLNGFPDEGAPDGWAYEESGLDAYGRAEKSLARAQQAIIEQRDRLAKVGGKGFMSFHTQTCCLRALGIRQEAKHERMASDSLQRNVESGSRGPCPQRRLITSGAAHCFTMKS